MSERGGNLIKWLFKTEAIKVAPPGNPFWYTSGTIGPYYINTHYLYGSEESASEMLSFIEKSKNEPLTCTGKILEREIANYENCPIYKGVIDCVTEYAENQIGTDKFDFISGGERRDWFLSVICAYLLDKPHLTLFKYGEPVIMAGTKELPVYPINGANVLHIADLVTEASSFIRSWIPAVSKAGAKMPDSLVVADRMQGGGETLNEAGTRLHSLLQISAGLFKDAFTAGHISREQFEIISEYIEDPRESMRRFLINNKSFLKDSLEADGKTSERARLCLSSNIYKL